MTTIPLFSKPEIPYYIRRPLYPREWFAAELIGKLKRFPSRAEVLHFLFKTQFPVTAYANPARLCQEALTLMSHEEWKLYYTLVAAYFPFEYERRNYAFFLFCRILLRESFFGDKKLNQMCDYFFSTVHKEYPEESTKPFETAITEWLRQPDPPLRQGTWPGPELRHRIDTVDWYSNEYESIPEFLYTPMQ